MLTREMCKGINNKMRGTGKRLNEVNKMYNTLTNSANGFLGTTARVDEVPMVAPKVEYKVVETIIEEPVKDMQVNEEFVIPYFNTPFYLECRLIAEATNRHVDDVAWEQVANQLGVSVERAIVLVSNGLVKLNF